MSKLYTVLQGLFREGKLTMMEQIAIAAACELAVASEHEAHIGRKVYPVLKELLREVPAPSMIRVNGSYHETLVKP